jgi:hypothetical protein
MKKNNFEFDLRPETSMSRMARPMHGNIRKVVRALMRIDAESELIPRFDRRTPTPACSKIWGV